MFASYPVCCVSPLDSAILTADTFAIKVRLHVTKDNLEDFNILIGNVNIAQ